MTETNEFTYGIGDRLATCRIPSLCLLNNKGYVELRSPTSDLNPYIAIPLIYFAAIDQNYIVEQITTLLNSKDHVMFWLSRVQHMQDWWINTSYNKTAIILGLKCYDTSEDRIKCFPLWNIDSWAMHYMLRFLWFVSIIIPTKGFALSFPSIAVQMIFFVWLRDLVIEPGWCWFIQFTYRSQFIIGSLPCIRWKFGCIHAKIKWRCLVVLAFHTRNAKQTILACR